MAMTIEDLAAEYAGREEDRNYFELQARLGTKKEAAAAIDGNGNFHCIEWHDCRYCPARRAECFVG